MIEKLFPNMKPKWRELTVVFVEIVIQIIITGGFFLLILSLGWFFGIPW
jgi:hypothetical protein